MTDLFNKHCREANRFIKDLSFQLGTPHDADHAIRVLQSVFAELRRRIIPGESLHLISQLPLILKGMYVDGWNINEPLSEAKTFNEFLDEIRYSDEQNVSSDFANDDLARKKIMIVFKALKKYIPDDELDQLRDELPKDVAEMV
jgi:uncharacterized protein (DUF2267 family)